jgi:sulfatase modifying factor 1
LTISHRIDFISIIAIFMTYHTIRLRYYIILTLLSFYSNLLYGYVVEPSYSWDGSKLVTDEIEFVLPGNWYEPDVTIVSEDTSDLLYKIIVMSRPVTEFVSEKVYMFTISFGASGRSDDFIQRGVNSALDSPASNEWYNYFTTKHGYSAGVVSQQPQGETSDIHNTQLYVQGQITEPGNSIERTGVHLILYGIAGQIDLNDVKSFTDGLKFNNSTSGGGSSDNSSNDGTVDGGEDSDNSDSGTKTWLWYKHYPWVYDHPSKEWIYLRGSANGEIYAYRSSTKKWDEFSATFLLENNEGKGDAEKTWEDNYEEWILDPEPYGGLNVLQQIKEAKQTGATELDLDQNNISDLTPLAGLTNLKVLDLNQNNISDLTPLSGLTNLKMLTLRGNNISDLTSLTGLTNLIWLGLDQNNISDLTSLAWLTNLITLNLEGNNISASQKAMLEEALPNTNITWPDVILDDSEEDSMVSTKTISLSLTVDLDLILVEPGTFTMGSPNSEPQGYLDESQSQVFIYDQFYMGKYEVTNEQWLAVMEGNTEGISLRPSFYSSPLTSPDHPVEDVSWNDIQVFFSRLNTQQSNNIQEGWEYKLPSESQWEYACRAGTTTAYFWGDSIDADDANYYIPPYSRPRKVGEYNPNPWGFYDMHGNLFEWTSDVETLFKQDGYDDDRIFRGGSFKHPKELSRSAYRSLADAEFKAGWLGFRVSLQKIEN